MNEPQKIKLGTRGSTLAIAQSEIFIEIFRKISPSTEVEIVIVKTQGDFKQNTSHAQVSDKRDWIHELDMLVAKGELDLACHSAKDVPVDIDSSTTLIAVGARNFPGDCLVLHPKLQDSVDKLHDLPQGASIGTASKRRQSQLLNIRSCLLYTSPSPRDATLSRMPSSA